METLFTLDGLVALISLTGMEIVLGIDNIVFIAVLVGKLPPDRQESTRKIGIALALLTRLLLLFSITWVMGLTEPLFSVFSHPFSGRDLILLLGGLFLIAKATYEIHEKLEAGPESSTAANASTAVNDSRQKAAHRMVLLQIVVLDIVFSLDSVITAVGMARHISLMVIAMVVAVGVMLVSSGKISEFVHRHPTIKILALSFLLLIGVMLFAEGLGTHIDKGYIYFAMAFSLAVEMLNLRYRKRRQPVELRERV